MLSRWFEPVPTSVPAARHLMQELSPWLSPDTMQDAQVIVSELASNAVVHAHTPFEVCVRLQPTFRLDVCDSSPAMPKLREPRSDECGGRGLLIVDACAQRWGADLVDGGKIVWADLGALP